MMDESIIENIYSETDSSSLDVVTQMKIEDIDFAGPSFVGFGITGALCLASLGIAALITILKR